MTRLIRFLFTLAVLATMASSCRFRRGDEFRIPAGFSGWVRVDYNVTGAPALKSSFSRWIIDVPPSGVVRTSSGRSQGYGLDKYLLIGPGDQKRELQTELDNIPCSGNKCILGITYFSTPSKTTMFFVGSPKEREASPMPPVE
jgi:hypothetical protein